MELELQKFLHAGHSLDELRKPPYSLIIKEEGDLVLFKYTQGVSDGFNPIVREARGIILSRENWDIVCHPFHRFFNFNQPEADALRGNLHIYEKVDGCFSRHDKVLLANGDTMTIGEIVNKKLSVEVLSYNFETKKIEPKKVIGWSKKKGNPEEWLTFSLKKVKTSLNKKSHSQHCFIRTTKNHVFFTEGLVEKTAEELHEGDTIYTPIYSLTPQEEQVTLGTLLGDGSLNNYQDDFLEKSLRFCHSQKQHDYVDYKASFLKKLGGKVQDKEVKNSFSPEKTIFSTLTHQGFYPIYRLVYDENHKKKVSKEWLEKLDWLGFAIWYMDDGHLDTAQKNNSFSLHTEGFSLEENQIIQKFYKEKGYKTYIRDDKKGHHFIHFSTEASEEIWKNIRQYICPSMQYKLPERHQGFFVESSFEEERELVLEPAKISKIEEGLPVSCKNSRKYDITVEDNHNYFCQGVLVHNSLAKLYYYKGKWRCASNGNIDAQNVSLNGKNFFGLVEKALNTHGYTWETFTDGLNHMKTYMYELATQDNPVVIKYTGYHLYYLGERNNLTGQEEYNPDPRIDNVKVYHFETFHDIVNSSLHMKDDEEGYVVRDDEWHRVKVKNPTYFLAHHLANNGRPDFLDILLNGDVKEFLNYFPQYEKDIKEMKEIFALMNEEAEMLRERTSEFWDYARKDFVASIAVPAPYQPFIFKCYEDHKLTWKKFTADWDYNKWKRFLKKNEYYFNPSEA